MQSKINSATESSLVADGHRLQRAISGLLRRFEYRDRNEICCHGVSVSQCHTLEAAVEQGSATMSALARTLYVSVSTMTRIVDGLERQGLVERRPDGRDRRVWRVVPTAAGQALAGRIRDELAAGVAEVLARVGEEHRESVILALEELTRAVDAWRSGTTAGGCCHDEV